MGNGFQPEMVLSAALDYLKAGVSVTPILADGTKKPLVSWKQYQARQPSEDEVRRWYAGGNRTGFGVGVICGKVSSNLEMLELEGRACSGASIDKIMAEAAVRGVDWLWQMLLEDGLAVWSPSGGLHLYYRIGDHEVPGNTKVARRPASVEELADNPSDKIKVLAETRGEGGYAVAPPSGGKVHPTGDTWSIAAGNIGHIAVVAWADRCALHEAVHAALDEMPAPVAQQQRTPPSALLSPAGTSPGTDFIQRTNLVDLMQSYGWTVSHQRGRETFLVRPGKNKRDGHSATVGYSTDGKDRLYVFSSSTEFPTETPLDAFAVYTHAEHHGDFSAAARSLRGQGFGSRSDAATLYDSARPSRPPADAPVPPPVGPDTARPVPDGWLGEWTETGAGAYVHAFLKDRFREVSQENAWRVYENGVWAVDRTKEVQRSVNDLTAAVYRRAQNDLDTAKAGEDKEEIAGAKANLAFAKACRSKRGTDAVIAKFSEHRGITVPSEAFDKNRDLVCFANGTLDLRDAGFREHRPEDMLTRRTGVEYDARAQAPTWAELLERVLPDRAVRDYVQRLMGYTLSGDMSEDLVIFVHGLPGCGKSTFLKVLSAALGDLAAAAAPATFRAKRDAGAGPSNDLHDLRGKRFVHTSETSRNTVFDEELLKRVAGGDGVRSRGLYQENVEWAPEFVPWIATNYPPKLSDDPAIWRRARMVRFPVQFGIEGGPEADKKIGDRIIASELPGVINWIVEGLRLYRTVGIADPQEVVSATESHRLTLNPVQQFLDEAQADERVVVEPGVEIRAGQLYDVYVNWCRDQSGKPVGANRFGQLLTELGFADRKGNKGLRYRIGIRAGSRGARGTMEPAPPW